MREFILLLPEVFLAITFLGIIAGEIGYHGEKIRLITSTALIGLGGALVQTIITYKYGAAQLFSHAVVIDGMALFFKLFFITMAILVILTSMKAKEVGANKRGEFCALVVASTLAMCLAASAADLLLGFLALQAMNIFAYFLSAFGRHSSSSTEAAMKHLVFGSVAGALLLFGIALLFSSTHAINIYDVHRAMASAPLAPEISLVVFMLMFLSLCFQIGAFPMHLWAPDVLEGAPTSVSALIAMGLRAAGFAVVLRVLLIVFSQPVSDIGQWRVIEGTDWTKIVGLVSGLTMMIGSLLALRQSSAKRMIAYLVMANTGFLLMGILVLDEVGVAAILYNLVVELFALIGALYILSYLFDLIRSDRMSDFNGAFENLVPECIALVLFLACLIGLPPLPGFVGKFTLIGAAVRHHWYLLALCGIVSTALATGAVARLSYSLFGSSRRFQEVDLLRERTPRRALLAALLMPIVLVGVFAEWVLSWAGQSLRFILW